MKRLELCHVSFSYTEEPLIEDLSLTIEEQEGCILLCGRNGAGKSTLLNLICGLYPHEGEIRRDDFHIAYLPYENPLMENETVLSDENGESAPYVIKELEPEIAGVVIACEGADNNTVAASVTEAAQVLFGISVNRIKVLKMEVHQ